MDARHPWHEDNKEEFLCLKETIRRAASEEIEEGPIKKRMLHLKTDYEPYETPLRFSSLNEIAPELREFVNPPDNTDDYPYSLETYFFDKYARILWGHNQRISPDAEKRLLEEIRTSMDTLISEEEKYLKKREYSKQAIETIKSIRLKGLKKQAESFPISNFIYSSKTPEAEGWIAQQDSTIYEIRELYVKCKFFVKNGKPNDKQISFNMGLVFQAVGFFPHSRKDSSEDKDRIQKRIQKIKKYPAAYPVT